jgi:capsular polysaccharide transport system permease protein
MQLTHDSRRLPVAGKVGLPHVGGLGGLVAKLPRGGRLLKLLALLIAALPSLFGITYFGFVASDRYVSETTFVVRSSNRNSMGGLSAFLRLIGVSTSRDDTYAVHDFVTSRDAISELERSIDLKAIFARQGSDWLSRYPNLFYGDSQDEFRAYLRKRFVVSYNPNTGISRLQVHAFTPEDSQRISQLLIEISEQLINRINGRIHADAVRFAVGEVQMLETRLKQTQLAITDFRNRELQIDPTRSSILVVELIARLSDELSRVTAQINEVSASAPSSPQLAGLERRATALRAQIGIERARVTDASDGLAQKIARYEELNLERELSGRALAAAIASLDEARAEARRQQLYLERISGPTLPEKAMMPERGTEIISIIGVNLLGLLVLWLLMTGATEHAPRLRGH